MLATASPPGSGGVTNRPARIVDNLGKVRVGDAVGLNDNQFGPVSLVGDATLFLLMSLNYHFAPSNKSVDHPPDQ